MIWYLLPIFIGGKVLMNEDFSLVKQVCLGSCLFEYSDKYFFIVDKHANPVVSMKNEDLSEMFSFQFKGKNLFQPLQVRVGSLVYVVFNVKYLGDPIDGLRLSPYPQTGFTNGLVVAFDFFGQLVKSLWVDFCEKDSQVLKYFKFERHYFIVRNSCKSNKLCVVGLEGEPEVCFEEFWQDLLVRQSKNNEIFFVLINQTNTQVVKAETQSIVYQASQKILDILISDYYFVLFLSKISKIDTSGLELKSFSLPLFTNQVLELSSQSLYLTFSTSSGFLSFNQSSEGTILLNFDLNLSLSSFRSYKDPSLSLLSHRPSSSSFLFKNDSFLLESVSPFAVSQISNCKRLKRNILGEAECFECEAGFSLIANDCFQDFSCPRNSVKDLFSFTCIQCYAGCSQCSGPEAEECLSCDPGHFFYLKTCRLVCPSSFYGLFGKCEECPSMCLTCDQKQCFQCKNSVLMNGTCIESCPKDFWPINGECKSCDIKKCETCSESFCKSCKFGYFLSNHQCEPCSVGCKKCLNTLKCLQCEENFNLIENTCRSCLELLKNCSECTDSKCFKCQQGFFLHQNTCFPCDENCEVCQDSRCVQCLPNFQLQNMSCVQCEELNCTSCTSNCLKCENSSCLSCEYKYELMNNSCLPCPNNCSKCSNQTCLICESGFLLQGFCTESCPKGTYLKNNECLKCPTNCRNCSDSTCFECEVNYLGHFQYLLIENSCKKFECFSGYRLHKGTCVKKSTFLTTFLKNIISSSY